MGKVPEYTKRAISAYREKYDYINVRFPKGTRGRIERFGSVNSFIVDCVTEKLDAMEDETESKAVEEY